MTDLAHHRVPAAGVELAVVTAGPEAAPPLVLLHGWPDTWRCWEAVIPLLATDFRIIAPDQRGFGESDMPEGTRASSIGMAVADLTMLLDHFEIERSGIVGHDFGGAVAWAAAGLVPDRVERLVVLASPHPMRLRRAAIDDPTQLAASFYVWLMHLGERGEALLAADGFRPLARWVFSGSKVPPEVIEAHVAKWSEPGRFHAMAGWYRANFPPELYNPDIAFELPNVQVPVRYIHAGGDLAFVPGAATGSGAYVDADFDEVLIEEASHWLAWDAPEQVAQLVADWMTRA